MGVHRLQAPLHQVRLARRRQPQRDVGLAHAEIKLGVDHQQRDRDLRIAIHELLEMRDQPDGPQTDRGVDSQMPGGVVLGLAEARLDRRHPCRHLLRGLEQDLALLGQHQAARMAMEQGRADILLERADLAADRRLAEPQALGRTREAAGLGDAAEQTDAVPIQHPRASPRRAERDRAAARGVLGQEFSGLEGGHAAAAGGGHRLAEDLVLDVAGGEHAGHAGDRAVGAVIT